MPNGVPAMEILTPPEMARRRRKRGFGERDNAVQHDNILGLGAGLLDHKIPKTLRGTGRECQADDLTPSPPLQRRLEHYNQVLRLFLDLDVAVAQCPE